MLHPFKAVKRGIGLHRDQFHAWLKFSQPSPGPNEGPARAKARDEMGDASRGLLEYFNARRFVMRAPVGRIVVLIGVKILVGIGRHYFAHGQDPAVRASARTRHDNFLPLSPP